MGTELWQSAIVTAAIAVVVVLWVLFVYLPRRTGEDTPQNLPKKIVLRTTRVIPESSVPAYGV